MLSKTRGRPVNSSAPGLIRDTITGPVSNGTSVARDMHVASAQSTATLHATQAGWHSKKEGSGGC
jgi:hypothetical protein